MICHVDMDAFFASVEQLDEPSLIGKCVIVGGGSQRGVVAAASYEARKFGVHSAMPMFLARQKCPQGIILHPRRHRYQEISKRIMETLRSVSPLVEPVSIDEAYLDISGLGNLYGEPKEIGRHIKMQIQENFQLTCSVGIAELKFLAKIASDMNKPDGLTYIPKEETQKCIDRLPIAKIPGIGTRTNEYLKKMGIHHVEDVKRYSQERIIARLGKFGSRLWELSHGIDRSTVETERPVKSVSSEETLDQDIVDIFKLRRVLLRQSEDIARGLRKKGVKAKTVTLKLKHSDFHQVSRQAKLSVPTHSAEILYRAAVHLLDEYSLTRPLRLIGMGASDLILKEGQIQRELFSDPVAEHQKWDTVGGAADAIRKKFGDQAIRKADEE